MEAVGVIGLVGNLTQFLSFGHEILSLSREAYRSASGATDDIRRITALTESLNQDFNFLSVQTTSYQNQLDDLAKAVRTQTQTYESQIMNAHKDHFASLRQITLQIASYIDSIRSTERFQRVIESLCFDGINARYNGIDEAHPGTLDWTVLERRTNFKEWLEKGAGVYWVNGLAGSGKSTLMRYMTTSQSTQAALQVWAATGNSQPVIASHFFWNSGSPMQKSLQGLLQTILYWLFRSSPSLIEALCLHRQRAQPWDLDELSRTLEMVAEAPERGVNIQYCLFIDGLDEFDGEVEMLVHTMTKLAASPNVKVCVSSRPWSCFLSAWGRSEFTFKVQDFNRPDIIKYVQDKLVNRDQLPTINATDIERLAAEITENSGGVWLWVRLVVRDLLRDIRDNEPVEQLYKRLRSIPSDLYEYFRKILHRVDPIYRQEDMSGHSSTGA
ncbi:hypothetical protein F4780DRAFT_782743 [Xylariomycetidae sp. FL0641]|nr:hypothetical protein F4780DRAFT_782743 [Xylariomycetidae sp. FL0641]